MLWFLACAPAVDTGPIEVDTADTSVPQVDPEPSDQGLLHATNSADRTGWFYRPEGWNLGTPDVVVLFHGTGGDGQGFGEKWVDEAQARGLVLVAPSSRKSPSGQWTWEVGGPGDAPTEDVHHALACLDEVLSVGVEPGRIVTAGFSGGGSSAPYHASLDPRFSAFGSLHGGVFPTGLGDNEVPGWFSTGEDDNTRPPDMVESDALDLQLYGWGDVTVRIFPGGHSVGPEERAAFLDWALPDD